MNWKDPITGQLKGLIHSLQWEEDSDAYSPLGTPTLYGCQQGILHLHHKRSNLNVTQIKEHSHIEPKKKKFLRASFLPFQIIDATTLVDTAPGDRRITYPLLADLCHCHCCAAVLESLKLMFDTQASTMRVQQCQHPSSSTSSDHRGYKQHIHCFCLRISNQSNT